MAEGGSGDGHGSDSGGSGDLKELNTVFELSLARCMPVIILHMCDG